MKPIMLFSIVLLTAIILAASFGLHIMPLDPLYNLSEDLVSRALYICPASNGFFDSFSIAIRPYTLYINMFFFFCVVLLLFFWGWALYQNLLKDAFNQKTYTNAWWFTKKVFWLGVIVVLLVSTPNHYRNVHLRGYTGNWVLCEANNPDAKPVLSDIIIP